MVYIKSFITIIFLSSIAIANFNNILAQKLELVGYFCLVDYTLYYICTYYIYQPFDITNTINIIISYAKFKIDI